MVADYCPLDGIAVRNPCRHSEWANSGPGVRRTENERRRSSRVPVRSTGTKCEGGRSHRGEEARPITASIGWSGDCRELQQRRDESKSFTAWQDSLRRPTAVILAQGAWPASDRGRATDAPAWGTGCRVTALPSPAESGPWTAKNDRRKGEREDWCDFCFLNFYKSLYDPNW